jgi:DHA1 family tetracycline resistance protein-like MFS transporter
VIGNLSDRFGRRPVLLLSVGALGIDYVIMGLAPTLGWLFVGRSVAGIAGASFTSAYAYVADVSPPDRRAQNFGLIGGAFGGGFILGPAIGGLLGELGPRAPFFAAAACSLLNVAYGVFVLPESLPLERRRPLEWKRANPLGTLVQLRKYPVVLGLLSALFLWQLAHQVMPSTWSYYTMYRFGWSEAIVGASLAFAGIVMAASQATLPRLMVPKFGEATCASIGLTFGALGFLGYAFATRGWMMFALLVSWFFGAVTMPSLNALMSRRIPPTAQGELQGGVASLMSLSAIVAPPVMTKLFAYFSSAHAPIRLPGAAFLSASLLAFTGLMLFRRAVGQADLRSASAETGAIQVPEVQEVPDLP